MSQRLVAAFLLLSACSASLQPKDEDGVSAIDLGFPILSFDTFYGDGHVIGQGYGHGLHYDRVSGNVLISKTRTLDDANTNLFVVQGSKKAAIDRALDTIKTDQVQEVYLTDNRYSTSAVDGLSMSIVLNGENEKIETLIDTADVEALPQGLRFLFETSLYEGQWYRGEP